MLWDYFSKDLKYQYVRLLLKDLNNAEMYYLRILRDGVDTTINSSINWINNNSDELNSLHDSNDWKDYFPGSELEEIWITLLNRNVDAGLRPLHDYYVSGGNLAYSHMSKNPVFQDSDRQAVDNLGRYVSKVITSINSELTNGLHYKIGENIESKADYSDLLDSGVKPLHYYETINGKPVVKKSYFSPYTRCLFTAKTEYARAVNTGLLQAYANYGVNNFDWVTSGLDNVCSDCLELEDGSPYTLDEILRLGCPYHVNCACSVKARLPVNIHLIHNPRVVDLTPNHRGK